MFSSISLTPGSGGRGSLQEASEDRERTEKEKDVHRWGFDGIVRVI
jgi:hypothetical protein